MAVSFIIYFFTLFWFYFVSFCTYRLLTTTVNTFNLILLTI
jgi:hypothetical protein